MSKSIVEPPHAHSSAAVAGGSFDPVDDLHATNFIEACRTGSDEEIRTFIQSNLHMHLLSAWTKGFFRGSSMARWKWAGQSRQIARN